MNTITRGIAGAALATGLALGGGVAANASEGVAATDAITTMTEGDARCAADFSVTERDDSLFEYALGIRCDALDAGVSARAVATFENADGTRSVIATRWLDRAPGQTAIKITAPEKAKAVDVRIEKRTSAGPIEG
jgi:hypothetical protein